MKLAVAGGRGRWRCPPPPPPWVLDPVATGATPYRTAAAADLALRGPAVIRGNPSEILVLAGSTDAGGKVSTAVHGPEDALEAEAKRGAGPAHRRRDRGDRAGRPGGRRRSHRPDPRRRPVDGADHRHGCTATALIGAFLGAGIPAFDAAVAGLAALGTPARRGETAQGPGSLAVGLLDRLRRWTLRDGRRWWRSRCRHEPGFRRPAVSPSERAALRLPALLRGPDPSLGPRLFDTVEARGRRRGDPGPAARQACLRQSVGRDRPTVEGDPLKPHGVPLIVNDGPGSRSRRGPTASMSARPTAIPSRPGASSGARRLVGLSITHAGQLPSIPRATVRHAGRRAGLPDRDQARCRRAHGAGRHRRRDAPRPPGRRHWRDRRRQRRLGREGGRQRHRRGCPRSPAPPTRGGRRPG